MGRSAQGFGSHAVQLRRAAPAAVIGVVSVLAGGLVAAVTATAPTEHGAWLAAYLVLVSGVAQLALAGGQAVLAPRPVSRRMLGVEMCAWNLGNLAVIVGTLTGRTLSVDVGGGLLVLALALLASAVRGAGRGVERPHRWVLLAFQVLLLVLLVSIPVGLWLAQVRRG